MILELKAACVLHTERVNVITRKSAHVMMKPERTEMQVRFEIHERAVMTH